MSGPDGREEITQMKNIQIPTRGEEEEEEKKNTTQTQTLSSLTDFVLHIPSSLFTPSVQTTLNTK